MERTGLEQWKAREVARLLSLIETERRYYQEMVASLPVPLAVLAWDRTIVSANRAFRQIVGLRSEDLRSKTIEQLLPSDDLVEHIRQAHVVNDKEPFFADINERTYRVAALPMQSWEAEGQPETLLMIEDLTEIDKSRSKSQTVAPAGIPAIIWSADASTLAFQSVTGAAEEMTGRPPDQWTSSPNFFWQRIHPEDLPQVKALYENALQKGGEANAEFRVTSPAGETVWLREAIRVPEPGPKLRSVVGVATNISRRKQLESQLLASSRVDAVRTMAARLAHDLNNPLMIINGYGEDLLGTFPKQDPRRADVGEIISASRRLTDLTSHLLSFTRRQAQTPEKIDLSKVVSDLEAVLQQNGTNVPVTTDCEKPLIAMADPDHVLGVLSTIAKAALALTQSPSSLHVSCQTDAILEHIGPATLPSGQYARVDFRATGLGLAENEYSGTAFESVLPAKDGRNGTALARAYAIVREWGGDIAISGDVLGALLVLYLPAPPEEPAVTQAPPAPAPVVAQPLIEPEPEPSRETILLVDDEPGIRGLVRRILRREHFNVIEAASGEEALAIALHHPGPVHLLLTDVMMPGMSGVQLAKSVQGAFPSIKVIFISGYSETEPAERFDNASFLQKPFTLTDLLRVVGQALEPNQA